MDRIDIDLTNIIDKQQKALKEFKNNVKDLTALITDDEDFARWLIARDWNLKKAEKMFRASIEWRKQFGTNSLLKWELPEVFQHVAGGYHGCDKLGHPIWIEPIGLLDLKGVFYSVSKKDILKHRVQEIEHCFFNLFPYYSKLTDRNIRQAVYIIDLEGVGRQFIWKPAVDVYTELLSIVEANYPEALYCAYVINVPRIFDLLYSLVKNFLHENTRAKIKILSKNWKEELLKDIDADQLPVYWGGTATDPDGDIYCKSKVKIGGIVPERFRSKMINSENVNTNNFLTTTVGKGSFVLLDFEVEKAGSLLRWNFWTADKDIGFGVYRRTGNSKQKTDDMEEVVPNSRVNSHMVPESDNYICEAAGTYVVRFDNTYSWINAKNVSYLIDVDVPDVGKELQRLDSTDL